LKVLEAKIVELRKEEYQMMNEGLPLRHASREVTSSRSAGLAELAGEEHFGSERESNFWSADVLIGIYINKLLRNTIVSRLPFTLYIFF
jgi:hypothetical protein